MINHKLKKKNFFKVLFESWYFMFLNVMYYLFYKKKIDKRVENYLQKKYKKDDVITVALHGIFEYYWQSYPRYQEYFDNRGKVLIPIGYNFFDHYGKSVEAIRKKIEKIHKETNAKIVLIGDSDGAVLGWQYMFKYNPDFVKKFVPIAGMYGPINGVAFWWYWIAGTPKELMTEKMLMPTKNIIPKTKVSLYAKHDAFIIPAKYRTCKNLENIGFDTGHFGVLYSKEVIKFVYDYIFKDS